MRFYAFHRKIFAQLMNLQLRYEVQSTFNKSIFHISFCQSIITRSIPFKTIKGLELLDLYY